MRSAADGMTTHVKRREFDILYLSRSGTVRYEQDLSLLSGNASQIPPSHGFIQCHQRSIDRSYSNIQRRWHFLQSICGVGMILSLIDVAGLELVGSTMKIQTLFAALVLHCSTRSPTEGIRITVHFVERGYEYLVA